MLSTIFKMLCRTKSPISIHVENYGKLASLLQFPRYSICSNLVHVSTDLYPCTYMYNSKTFHRIQLRVERGRAGYTHSTSQNSAKGWKSRVGSTVSCALVLGPMEKRIIHLGWEECLFCKFMRYYSSVNLVSLFEHLHKHITCNIGTCIYI